jgi:hypothetical protein
MSSNSVRFGSILRRALPVVSAIALGGAVTMSITQPAEGTLPYSVPDLRALHEIEDLEYCYAAGTDAIGRGDYAEGKQIYSKCFVPNAPIVINGTNPDDPPAVALPSAEAWADFLIGYFPSLGYVSTQHLISNVRIDIHPNGNSAKITSYLNATHVVDPTGRIEVAYGNYHSEAVRTPFGWKLKKRTFNTLAFLPLESPPAP